MVAKYTVIISLEGELLSKIGTEYTGPGHNDVHATRPPRSRHTEILFPS